jgi:hypothetical protein
LYFFPLPQGQGALRPIFIVVDPMAFQVIHLPNGSATNLTFPFTTGEIQKQ